VDWYREYWAAYDFFSFGHVSDPTRVFRLYALLPFGLMFVPTVLMGFSFPVLQRAVQDDPAASGRRVGALQAANIAGCTAGSLLVGLVAFEAVGTAGTIRLLVVAGTLFAVVGLWHYGRGFLVPLAVLALVGTLVPDSEALWRRLHGLADDAGLVFFEEDGTGVVALTPEPGARWRLSVNGKGNSWLPYGRGHTILGAVPASIHPAPRRVAIVGLGSGDTVWAASYRPETVSTTVFEISRPQPRVLWRFLGFFDMLELRYLLEDPRLQIRLEDARKALASETRVYDLVEADATWPESAGSGNLYSLEFFRTVARRLAGGGVMCTWAPTPRVSRTFRTVFPHVIQDETGTILVGSLRPIPVEPETWVDRVTAGEPYLGRSRVEEVREALEGFRAAPPRVDGDLNRDLFPRDELAVAQ
jgi:predicted membrane-bound spermidine synthase